MRSSRLGASVLLCLLLAAPTMGQDTKATLATDSGASIFGDQLASWIDEFIPGVSNRLIVLTQCFGGDMAGNFAGKANTAVGSATSPGEEATYGGYDDDAAGALKPEAGRTGNSVHTAGTAGKDATETPSTGGGMGLGSFPLDPVGTNNIESRHVLVYAGKPDAGAGRDNDQRDTIVNNFAGEANTSVTTVGGAGGGGWQHPGTAAGLRQALKDIGTTIANSPNPDKEQFILFVTDHGDLHKVKTPTTPIVPPNIPTVLDLSFITFTDNPATFGEHTLQNDPNNITSWSLFVDLHGMGVQNTPGLLDLPNNCAPLLLLPSGGGNFQVDSFFDIFVDLDLPGDPGHGIVGNRPGEGIQLRYDIPEQLMVDSFFDVFTEIRLMSFTNFLPPTHPLFNSPLLISSISQDSGSIAKLPEPGSALALLAMGLVVLHRRRFGR